MREKLLAVAIRKTFHPLSVYHRGPVSPYSNIINKLLYQRMLGQHIIYSRSIGKTSLVKDIMYAERYSAKVRIPA